MKKVQIRFRRPTRRDARCRTRERDGFKPCRISNCPVCDYLRLETNRILCNKLNVRLRGGGNQGEGKVDLHLHKCCILHHMHEGGGCLPQPPTVRRGDPQRVEGEVEGQI